MFDLSGNSALITGASGGIGAAIARALHASGATVVLHGTRAERLAALATEAKEKEIGAKEFERILEEVIKLTGLKDPQAAMEAANEKLQKEIELMMAKIKANKELMDEADSWQKFGELLASMNQEQVESFIGLLQNEIRAL